MALGLLVSPLLPGKTMTMAPATLDLLDAEV